MERTAILQCSITRFQVGPTFSFGKSDTVQTVNQDRSQRAGFIAREGERRHPEEQDPDNSTEERPALRPFLSKSSKI